MGHIRNSIVINAPVESVWAFLVDYQRAPEWQANTTEVRDFDGTPGEVGFAYTAILKAMGRRLEGRSTITASERPRFIEEHGSASGTGKYRVTNTLAPTAEGGTALSFEMEYEFGSGFLGGIANKLIFERSIERDVQHSAENLKELIESQMLVPA
jgi:uncharacterized membrane protein